MSLLIAREKSSHWYLADGTPFYQCEKADGSGMRAVTIRDARKVGALPSVTNILGVLNKPGLEAWKQEQAILAALTLPRQEGEPLDAFARRCVADMGEQSKHAAEFGTRIHEACQNYAADRTLPPPEVAPYIAAWREWFDTEVLEVIAAECVLVSKEWGYAGKTDLIAKTRSYGTAVADFKTQGIKPGKPPTFYPEWEMQLGAYAMAAPVPVDCGLSVVVNSTEPGPVYVERRDIPKAFDAFTHALALWHFLKS